jgi:Rv0623-like transcription factor
MSVLLNEIIIGTGLAPGSGTGRIPIRSEFSTIQYSLRGNAYRMALNIRNPEAEQLAAELARKTGEKQD